MDFHPDKLYHISEEGSIALFKPRPSPSPFQRITGDVVFAISGQLVHNYLLPRNCPRVTFYKNANTSQQDKELFFGCTSADYIIAIEADWLKALQQVQLYCYELPSANFILLDECAGYYISYEDVTPVSVQLIPDALEQICKRNVELRIMQNVLPLADKVISSTLSFSLIRMRNAKS